MSLQEPIICQRGQALERCVAALTEPDVPAVIFDCEGVELGRKDGTLTIIGLRVCKTLPSLSQSFLVDVLAVSQEPLFKQLVYLLLSDYPLKVVFDGRRDFVDLVCTFTDQHSPLRAPTPNSALDLQIVDILTRQDSPIQQRRRLFRLFPPKVVHGKKGDTSQIVLLNGLQGCLQDHNLGHLGSKDKVDHSRWLERPLPSEYWTYVAKDVLLIENLFRNFVSRGLIPYHRRARDLASSHRYISMWGFTQKEDIDDSYRNHPMLPIDILVHSGDSAPPLSSSSKFCQGCRRYISIGSKGQNFQGQFCSVCTFVPLRKPRRVKQVTQEKGKGEETKGNSHGNTPRNGKSGENNKREGKAEEMKEKLMRARNRRTEENEKKVANEEGKRAEEKDANGKGEEAESKDANVEGNETEKKVANGKGKGVEKKAAIRKGEEAEKKNANGKGKSTNTKTDVKGKKDAQGKKGKQGEGKKKKKKASAAKPQQQTK